MMTRRGFYTTCFAVLALAFGTLTGIAAAALVGATLLAALLAIGLDFAWTVRRARRNLDLVRTVNGRPFGAAALAAGRMAKVRTVLRNRGGGRIVGLLEDRPPTLGSTSGPPLARIDIPPRGEAGVEAALLVPAAGVVRYEGAALHLADPQGFFARRIFLRAPAEALALPGALDVRKPAALRKAPDLLPMRGLHRAARAGSGSELFDLRDYQPGDSPRQVAWKLSARREELVVRLLEQEAPIRCWLLVDARSSLKVGPPGRRPFDVLVEVAAAAARRIVRGRDPVGLALASERGVAIIAPAAGERRLWRLLATLAREAADPGLSAPGEPAETIAAATRFAAECFPDWLDPEINRADTWLGQLRRWLWPGLLYGGLFLLAAGGVAAAAATLGGPAPGFWSALALLCGVLLGVVAIARMIQTSARRRAATPGATRKQLAQIIAREEGLGVGALGWLLENDAALAEAAGRWLDRRRADRPRVAFAPDGSPLYADPAIAKRLANAIRRAAAGAGDRLCLVLMADVLETAEGWDDLHAALRSALARRHQAIFIAPWPEDAPPPASSAWRDEPLYAADPLRLDANAIQRLARLLEHRRRKEAYDRVAAGLAKLGIPCLAATDPRAAAAIVDRLELLRRARAPR